MNLPPIILQTPEGEGPFPALILAPGLSYGMTMPLMAQVALALLDANVAVIRFDWHNKPVASNDLSLEEAAMQAVLEHVRADPLIDGARVFLGGKSLGSLVAWRVFAQQPECLGVVLLTPLCNHVTGLGESAVGCTEEHYPGLATSLRPVLLVAGDNDSVCRLPVLYQYAAAASGPLRLAVVGGDHQLERPGMKDRAAIGEPSRGVNLAAELVADFVLSY